MGASQSHINIFHFLFLFFALLQLFHKSDGQQKQNVVCFKKYVANDRCRRPMVAPAADAAKCCARQRAQGYSEVKNKHPRLGYECKSCDQVVNQPIDGGWSDWSKWSVCSLTCGRESIKTRTRSCTKPVPQFGGQSCGEKWAETTNCNKKLCSVDGAWGAWSKYGDCSVTCGNGVHTRTRKCDNPVPVSGGKKCAGNNKQTLGCNRRSCPIHGNWNSWSQWSSCSATCDNGIRQRLRVCNNPAPKNGGLFCQGKESEILDCVATTKCPIQGGWSGWSSWSVCYSSNCSAGLGLQVSQRTCNNPRPQYNGLMCQGAFIKDATCFSPINCAIIGEWSEWSPWKCVADGVILRTRTCKYGADVSPARKTVPCKGDDNETKVKSDSALTKMLVEQVCKQPVIVSQSEDRKKNQLDSGSGSGSGFGSGSGSGSGSGDGDQED